jgi:hypothetical protein
LIYLNEIFKNLAVPLLKGYSIAARPPFVIIPSGKSKVRCWHLRLVGLFLMLISAAAND